MSASKASLLFFCLSFFLLSSNGEYMIGVGRYDITGPAVQVEMVREREREKGLKNKNTLISTLIPLMNVKFRWVWLIRLR